MCGLCGVIRRRALTLPPLRGGPRPLPQRAGEGFWPLYFSRGVWGERLRFTQPFLLSLLSRAHFGEQAKLRRVVAFGVGETGVAEIGGGRGR
jgi:hypothetical protein